MNDALAKQNDAQVAAYLTSIDPKAAPGAAESTAAKSEAARQAVIAAIIKGAGIRANDGKLVTDTPEWAASVRAQITQWETDHPGYSDGLDDYLSHLPKFHKGGKVPGTPGEEVPAMLLAGETVTRAGASSGYVDNRQFTINLPSTLTYDRARARLELVTLLREHTRLNPNWMVPL